MAPNVNIYAIQRRGVSGYENYETLVTPTEWGEPEDLARKQLDNWVQHQIGIGDQVEEYDGVTRVLAWTNEPDLYEGDNLPTQYPAAMVTWRKPDTSILDAAVKAAAIEWRNHTDADPDPATRAITRARYDGAYRVADAVHTAYNTATGHKKYADLGDMIETTAALLADHR